MNDPSPIADRPAPRGVVWKTLTLAPRGVAAGLDAALGQRGLIVIFLATAALLSVQGWLRPPLSGDIRGTYISFGFWPTTAAAENLLHGPHRVVPDAIGIVLLVAIAVAAIVVLLRPKYAGIAAGCILVLAIAGNAAAAFNHPLLIQVMDREFEQRQQMSHALGNVAEDAMPNPTNGRPGILGLPDADEQPGDLGRGLLYLRYGRWLVLWAAVGLLCGVSGPLSRRLGGLAVALLVGTALAGIVTGRRLYAEYQWQQAIGLEGTGAVADARASLNHAVDVFPEFAQLDRTWLLTGKLDHLAGQRTPQADFFRAYQVARDKVKPRVVAYQEDLPWLFPAGRDYRMGLASPPSSFNSVIATGEGKSGTAAFRKSWTISMLPGRSPNMEDDVTDANPTPSTDPRHLAREEFERPVRFARARAARIAIGMLNEALGKDENTRPVVQRELARVWAAVGLAQFEKVPTADQADKDDLYFWRDTFLTAAQDAWDRAAMYDPARRDCAFYRGMTQARLEPSRPEAVAALLRPAADGMADQIMLADMLTVLGDAYFEGGQAAVARQLYARSFDLFCLPKVINLRAQGRLGGR